MKKISVTDYAKYMEITRQAVLAQIKERRLPTGVTAEKIGNAYVLTIGDEQKKA